MNQADFNKILEKYMAGTCSETEKEVVWEWYKNVESNGIDPLTETEKQGAKQRIWDKIKVNTVENTPILRFRLFKYRAIAASFLLLISVGWYFLKDKKTELPPPSVSEAISTVIDIKNTSQKPQQVTLEDGSEVVLQPNSLFSYPEHFGTDNRTVYLTGEALFKIKRNPSKPFLVHSGNLVTEVLGTSFIIRPNTWTKTTEVCVLSGKVSVYENDKKDSKNRNGVLLTPNHKAVFNNTTKELISSIVDAPIVVHDVKPKQNMDFVFEDTRLPIVLDLLKKRYELDIIVENESLNNCVFTAELNGLPLFTQLDYICDAIGARYERRGTNIFINGKGCSKE
jgi:transmembrane sensor